MARALLPIATVLALAACGRLGTHEPAPARPGTLQATAAGSPVFTTAHATAGEAVRDFLGTRPRAEQPIAFPHKVHVAQKIGCTEYCHESVTKGPVAGLPSVKTCMICHESVATDRPLVQKVADYQKRNQDIPWQRVYGFTASAHVRFNHEPHIRAGVDCRTCHGDVASQTVAERTVDLDMGFCVQCHREKQASNDCMTCHY